MHPKKGFFALFLFSFLFFSCLSENHIFEAPAASYIPDFYVWNQVTPEVSYADVVIPEFPLIYHLVKIDLTSTNLEVFEYHEKGEKSDRAVMITSLEEEAHPLVVTNTSPFNYSNRLALKFSWMPSTYNSLGIHISEGAVKSEPVQRYCALAFFKEGDSYRASIFDSQSEEGLLFADYAFGGFFTILRNYEILKFPANNYDSRNGAGLADDGKTLYLLAVEGERQSKSIGLPYPDCAEIFLNLGCRDAMQFDGGGTTCLFINGENILTYKPFRKSPAFMGFRLK